MANQFLAAIAPVSYTHLDVYKRQVPDFQIGGGGHLNIFRLIYLLEKLGYNCRVVIIHSSFNSADEAREKIRTHFYPCLLYTSRCV